MAVPDYQTIMLPLLQLLSDGKVYTTRELIEGLAGKFNLTGDERKELLPSGQQPIFDNRVGWARTYMKKAGLIESDKRGTQKISARGLEVLKQKPNRIDVTFLEQYPEFMEFRTLRNAAGEEETTPEPRGNKTPEELLEANYTSIQADLAHDLLDKIKSCTPEFFEKLVVDLVVGMGYGGSRLDAGKAVGKSGDGGIDGIIKEDRLGLDTIYIQAKRWEASVPLKEVRDFTGALLAKGAHKGIFVTTSQFSKDAYEHANSVKQPKIVLIDGAALVSLMIELGIGVSAQKTYKISKIDSDYFEE